MIISKIEMVVTKYPANLCWSSTRLQRDNFSSCKTTWTRLGRWKMVTLKKTSSRHVFSKSWRYVFKTFSRRLGDKQNVYDIWGYLYLTNLNLHLANLYHTILYLANLWQIQNALIITQKFRNLSYFETQAKFLF